MRHQRSHYYFVQFINILSSPLGSKTCKAKIELMFLVDGSGSIEAYGKGNFKRCLNFVKQVASSFTISRTEGRISVTVFSSRPQLIFTLNRYTNVKEVYQAVDRIRSVQ